jgi:hypothetical protein
MAVQRGQERGQFCALAFVQRERQLPDQPWLAVEPFVPRVAAEIVAGQVRGRVVVDIR